MKSSEFQLIRYDADEGMVFDWVEPRFHEEKNEETGEITQVQDHLYAKTLFIGSNDSISNYIEVLAPVEEA